MAYGSSRVSKIVAHSKPSEIDWKYGEPIAEWSARNTGDPASGWPFWPDRSHCRLVALHLTRRAAGQR